MRLNSGVSAFWVPVSYGEPLVTSGDTGKHLVHFGICCIGQEELLQVSAKLRIGPTSTQ
jgi:hypothetical protein